jgi:hypothetical protein
VPGSNPKYWEKAEVSMPREFGNLISESILSSLPLPLHRLVVDHSPASSTVRIAASSWGEE